MWIIYIAYNLNFCYLHLSDCYLLIDIVCRWKCVFVCVSLIGLCFPQGKASEMDASHVNLHSTECWKPLVKGYGIIRTKIHIFTLTFFQREFRWALNSIRIMANFTGNAKIIKPTLNCIRMPLVFMFVGQFAVKICQTSRSGWVRSLNRIKTVSRTAGQKLIWCVNALKKHWKKICQRISHKQNIVKLEIILIKKKRGF